MRGGVLRHHGGTALHACDDTVSLRMVEIPGENVGLGRRGYGRVHCSTDLPDRMVTGWYRRVGCRMFLRSRYGCSDCSFVLCTACLHVYDHTSSRPNLLEPYDSPPSSFPPSDSTYNRATPALVHFRRASRVALLSTDVRWPIACIPGRPLWGRAPRWNIKTDLTPRAAATISRVRMGFRCCKIRASPRGGVASHPPEPGAYRPCFFQTIMVKQSWSGALALG